MGKALLRFVIIVVVVAVSAVAVTLSLLLPTSTRRSPSSVETSSLAKPTAEPIVDTDYVIALTTADKFMQAWSSRNAEAGYAVLTDRLKQSRDKAELMQGISGMSNPHHQAYEIADGRRVDKDTFQFSVWTYEWYTGEQIPTGERPKPGTLVLKRQGEFSWLVDQLP